MALCGSFNCGCGITSTPAVSGAVNGYLPTIAVAGSGEPGDPYDLGFTAGWTDYVASHIATEEAAWVDYVPTLINITIGNGTQVHRYLRLGGPNSKTFMVSNSITFGSTTALTGWAAFSLPLGLLLRSGTVIHGQATLSDVSTGTNYNCQPAVYSGLAIGPVAFAAGGTYVTFSFTGPAAPFAWAVGDALNQGFIFEAT